MIIFIMDSKTRWFDGSMDVLCALGGNRESVGGKARAPVWAAPFLIPRLARVNHKHGCV